jgi:drug/metabolite transporter (DMT)-like permease
MNQDHSPHTPRRGPDSSPAQPMLLTYLALTAAVLFWGSSFVATKIALQSFSVFSYIFIRFALAGIVFGILLKKSSRPRLPGRIHLQLLAVAFFEPGLYFVLETVGLQRTSASSASIIIASIPVVVALVAAVLLKEKLRMRGWSGIVLSLAGIAVLTLFDDNPDYQDISVIGNLLVFLSALSASGYIITARRLAARLSALEITGYQILYGALFFLPMFLLERIRGVAVTYTAESVAALIFLVIFSTVIAFLSYNYALTRIDASRAAVFLNGVPVVTVVVAAVMLGESLGILQLIGGAVVLTGVTITNTTKPKTAPKIP